MSQDSHPSIIADTWLDRFFEHYYRCNPVNATFIGVHEHDHLLPDCSANGLTDTTDELSSLLDDLHRLPRQALSSSQVTDIRLAEGQIRLRLWEMGSRHFEQGNPSYYTGEAIFGAMSLLLRETRPVDVRIDTLVSRLLGWPALFDQARKNLTSAPQAWIERATDECDGGLKFLADGLPRYLSDNKIDHPHVEQASQVASETIGSFQSWLRDDLRRAKESAYSCGPDAMNLYLRHGHQLEIHTTAILEEAKAEFERRLIELERGSVAFGASDWQSALSMLAEDHQSVEDYYTSYQRYWEQCHENAERFDLLTWPDYPIRFVPRPEWARSAAPHLYFLFYRSPAPFDDVGVVDYLVEPIEPGMPAEQQERLLRATNTSQIKLNHVAHHGGIGHHVQNWHAFRAESRIGRIAAVDCASRIAMFCGGTMAEGWSSYATELMGETDFVTPLERYSMHYTRLRMAARAICDVQLHSGKWSLHDVISFNRDRVGMAEGAARGEAVKNSMFPGTALMYLTGTEQIHELRRRKQQRQGQTFSLREFHDQFLNYGSIPVSLIVGEME